MPYVLCDLDAEELRLVCTELAERVQFLHAKVETLDRANRAFVGNFDSHYETIDRLFRNQERIRIELAAIVSVYINHRAEINERLEQIS